MALPLHPEYGTEPNVFYVPPLAPPRFDANGEIDESKPRIPIEYLVSLFGPRVLEALEMLKAEMAKTRAGGKSSCMDLLIAYEWKDMFGGFDRDPGDDRVEEDMSTGRASRPADLPARERCRRWWVRGLGLGLFRLRAAEPATAAPGVAAAARGAGRLRRLARRLPRALAWDKVVRSSTS